MWQISSTRWLNPLMIVYVRDYPERNMIDVGTAESGEASLQYQGEERLTLLRFLEQASQQTRIYQPDDDPRDIPF